jgi:hypothetical protein
LILFTPILFDPSYKLDCHSTVPRHHLTPVPPPVARARHNTLLPFWRACIRPSTFLEPHEVLKLSFCRAREEVIFLHYWVLLPFQSQLGLHLGVYSFILWWRWRKLQGHSQEKNNSCWWMAILVHKIPSGTLKIWKVMTICLFSSNYLLCSH